jgi:NAD(P)-dependent dehydrogenase (short-subunit alcohol dehydrogenase family)
MRRYEGKVVLCVGAATGMGAETARRLAGEGARVAIGDINLAGAEGVAGQITAAGGEAIAVSCNIAEEPQVRGLVETVMVRLGRLDAMHLNAARASPSDGDAIETDLALFDAILTVNLRGHLLCTRHGIPAMLQGGGGAIVYTSSNVGKIPMANRVSYQVSKAALNGLMRHVALRWGREGVRANAITPGMVLTDALKVTTTEEVRETMRARLPSPRLGAVEDIAALVAFLLSDEASWINGQAFGVDGGSVIHS